MEQEKVLSFNEYIKTKDVDMVISAYDYDSMRDCHEWTKRNEQNRIMTEVQSLDVTEYNTMSLKNAVMKIILDGENLKGD